MKKVLFIFLCSFVSFAFTTNEKIVPISVENAEIILPMEVKEYPVENGTITVVTPARSVCDEGVVSNLIIEVDCGDGYGYSWSGQICYEHIEALVEQFQSSC